MKVCPSCNTRYDQGEEFCPSDGSELVDARELSPGELTGKEIADGIHLEALDRADPLGERYDATLEAESRDVSVTVFNQEAEPRAGRAEEMESLVESLSAPVPEEILAVHSYGMGDADPAYVVEEAAEGRSLRMFLEDTGSFDWRPASRITAHLARALDWMGERGYIHAGVYPEAIYLSESNWVGLQVGDWLQAELTYHDDPLGAVDDEPFVGFAPYLSPEALRDDASLDERSLVYTLGMIFYEMILGKPPFTSGGTEEILKRHLHEKPLKISIAASDRELHPELDDIFEMMWAKDPSDRFQTPDATISALATLVGEKPEEFAPIPEPAAEPIFSHPGESESDDEQSTEEAETESALPDGATDGADDTEETETEPGSDPEQSEGDSETITGSSVESSDESGRSRVRSGEVEISDPELAAAADSEPETADSDGPSIIIEDPELQSAMRSGGTASTGGQSIAGGENGTPAGADDSSPWSWTDALENDTSPPTEEAFVAGFVDADLGLGSNPDGQSAPTPVRARDLTGASPVEVDDETHSPTSHAESEGPAVEINPDAAEESPEPGAVDPTAESSQLKEDVERAKAELEREERDDGEAGASIPSPSDVGDEESASEPEEGSERGAAETADDGEASVEDEEVIVLDESSEVEDDADDDATDLEEPSTPPEIPDVESGSDTTADRAPEQDAAADSESEAEEAQQLEEPEIVEPEVVDDEVVDEEKDEATELESESAETAAPDDAPSETQPEVAEDKGAPEPPPQESEADTGASEPAEEEDFAAPSSNEVYTGDQVKEADEDVTGDWFEVSDEEAWMASDVRKERDRSEVIRQYATRGFIALLLTAALGLIVYSLTYSPSEQTETPQESEQTADE